MENCTLCLTNPADKTGSHLIPSFLLKMVENYDGSTVRDRGLGFRLTSDNTEVHFERAVSGEKINEVMGEVPEEELCNYPSPSIRDHVYCRRCESFFSKLEGAYSPTLKKEGKGNYESTQDALSATLHWLSIFWRTSAAGVYGYSLSEDEQERLRGILAHYAENDLQGEQPAALQNIGYKIVRSINFAEDLNSFISFNHLEIEPYCTVIGEYAAFLYFDASKHERSPADFFGFEKLVPDAAINTSVSGEQILAVSKDIFLAANQSLADKMSELKTGHIEATIFGMAKAFGLAGTIPAETLKEIAMKIPDSNKPSGRKYDKMEIYKLIAGELAAYFDSQIAKLKQDLK